MFSQCDEVRPFLQLGALFGFRFHVSVYSILLEWDTGFMSGRICVLCGYRYRSSTTRRSLFLFPEDPEDGDGPCSCSLKIQEMGIERESAGNDGGSGVWSLAGQGERERNEKAATVGDPLDFLFREIPLRKERSSKSGFWEEFDSLFSPSSFVLEDRKLSKPACGIQVRVKWNEIRY